MDQIGGNPITGIILTIFVLAVLGFVGWALYYLFTTNAANVAKAAAAAKTPTTTTPTTTPTTYPTTPINCKAIRPTYLEVSWVSWGDGERNNAIWILNNQIPSLSIEYLMGLSKQTLQTLVHQYCGPIVTPTLDCITLNTNYKPTLDYTSWTDVDRNAAIDLINNHYPGALGAGVGGMTKVQDMNNSSLQQLVKIYCK
jgi:hypothetical protein